MIFLNYKASALLVCSSGSLGQHCVLSLNEFRIKITTTKQVKPQSCEIPTVPE